MLKRYSFFFFLLSILIYVLLIVSLLNLLVLTLVGVLKEPCYGYFFYRHALYIPSCYPLVHCPQFILKLTSCAFCTYLIPHTLLPLSFRKFSFFLFMTSQLVSVKVEWIPWGDMESDRARDSNSYFLKFAGPLF